MMVPTVGRLVHFYTKISEQQADDRREGPYAALVTGVPFSGSLCADLLVAPNGREGYHAMMVNFGLQSGGQFWWEWPPQL